MENRTNGNTAYDAERTRIQTDVANSTGLIARMNALETLTFGDRMVDAQGNVTDTVSGHVEGSGYGIEAHASGEYEHVQGADGSEQTSISGEGGSAPTECDDPAVKNDDICRLRVTGIKNWAEMLRSVKPKS